MSYPLPVTCISDGGEDPIMTLVEKEACEIEAEDRSPRRTNASVDMNGGILLDEDSMSVEFVHTSGNDFESLSEDSGDCCKGASLDDSDVKSKWNMSNRFLRPRIFCLEHALEVLELLQRKGGANVLVLCHSDYPKIKAHAESVAENVHARIDCLDVPLKTASSQDLELINVSIGDEEHDEDVEDWTSRMGLNLRYCVKLRKQSSSNQEQLTLSLGGLFSEQGPPIISALRWHCKKARTHRCAAPGHLRARGATTITNDKADTIDTFVDSYAGIQVEKPVNSEVECKRHHGHPRKNLPRESFQRMVDLATNANSQEECKKRRGRPRKHPPKESFNKMEDTARGLPGYLVCADKVSDDEMSKYAGSKFSSGLDSDDVIMHQHRLNPARKEIITCTLQSSLVTEMTTECPFPAQELTQSLGHTSTTTASGQQLQQSEVSSCAKESSQNCDTDYLVESEFQQRFGPQTDADLGKGIEQENHLGTNMAVTDYPAGPAQLQDLLVASKDFCNSNLWDYQLTRSKCIVDDSEPQEAITELITVPEEQQMPTHADSHTRMEGPHPTDTNSGIGVLGPGNFEINQALDATMEEHSGKSKINVLQNFREDGVQVQLKLYERRRKKRQGEEIRNNATPMTGKKKREVDRILHVQLSSNGFIRSPCEGLRPRKGQLCQNGSSSMSKKMSQMEKSRKGHGNFNLVCHKEKEECACSYQCDLQGCRMSFQTRRELTLHKRNRCTYKGCGKRFISHKYAMRHQCVHEDDRPLKCPWKGCNVSFKWAWARTEHVRLHTGERPYKCKAPGCGMTFRFVSDFSRHRRKSGHSQC